MSEQTTSPTVVLHDGHRYVLTAKGVTKVVPAPTMSEYLAAKRAGRGR